MATDNTITVGVWVHYCGSLTELRGQLFEVVAANSDYVTLRGALVKVRCRATSVRVVPPEA
jgi:hypothetical protein